MAEKLWPSPTGSINVNRTRPAGITVSSLRICVRTKLNAASRPLESCSTKIEVSEGNPSTAGISRHRLDGAGLKSDSGAFGTVVRRSPIAMLFGISVGSVHVSERSVGQRRVVPANALLS